MKETQQEKDQRNENDNHKAALAFDRTDRGLPLSPLPAPTRIDRTCRKCGANKVFIGEVSEKIFDKFTGRIKETRRLTPVCWSCWTRQNDK